MKRLFLLVAAVLAALIAVVVLMREPEPVKIGYLGSLTGKFADLGKTCRDGAILAVEQLNAGGGVNGRPLVVTFRDDVSLPEKAEESFRGFIETGVDVVIGPLISSNAKQILPLVNEFHLPTVGPVVAGDFMAGKDDYFIKLFPASGEFGVKIGELAVRKKSKGRFVTIHDDQNPAYAMPIIAGFNKVVADAGATVVEAIEFNSLASPSYDALAKRINESDPDGVLLITSSLSAANLVQQLKKLGSKAEVYSSSWAASNQLISNGGMAVEGMFFYVPFDKDSALDSSQSFVRSYEERFSEEPTYCSAFNYDAVMLVADVLRESGQSGGAEFKEAVQKVKRFHGVQGPYEIDENGDARRQLFLQTVKDGKFVVVNE